MQIQVIFNEVYKDREQTSGSMEVFLELVLEILTSLVFRQVGK